MPEPAIVVLTPHGAELGCRIIQALGQGEVIQIEGTVRHRLAELFRERRPIVAVMALGIVVRIIGPLAQDKTGDPPVVVVDEAGQFAISVLGGHGGGANELARQVAGALGAVAVVTTASDALGLPALDLLGREWGWKIERQENLTSVMAAMVRGERIAAYQTAGRELDWPASYQRITSWPPDRVGGAIIISDTVAPALEASPTIVYRPPSLVLGVGCRRGVPVTELEAWFDRSCRTHGFSPLSLGLVATAVLKADEPGLQQFAANHGVPLRSFSLEEIAAVANLPTPSAKVEEMIGVPGVAEPCAMLGAQTNQLVMTKYKNERITMALARREGA